ncbi:MAG: hypothetical protein Q9159_000155 [Coniocarpon cinnabarinum]
MRRSQPVDRWSEEDHGKRLVSYVTNQTESGSDMYEHSAWSSSSGRSARAAMRMPKSTMNNNHNSASKYSHLKVFTTTNQLKRVEPYFQLSKPGGGSGEETILLDYATDFIALVPFRALKRRQWSVFCAGVATVFASWTLSPLMGAVLNLETITINSTVSLNQSPGPMSIDDQKQQMGVTFFNEAYTFLWLNGSKPAFTTPGYALAPVVFTESAAVQDSHAFVEVETTQYFTDLDCTPASLVDSASCEDVQDQGSSPYASNDGDCVTWVGWGAGPDTVDNDKRFSVQYMGFSSYHGAGLQMSCDCDSSNENLFLASITDRGSPQTPDLGLQRPNQTILFCRATYSRQQVKAVINVVTSSVVSATPTGPPSSLPLQSFNTSHFNFLLNTAVYSLSRSLEDLQSLAQYGVLNKDIGDANIPPEYFRMQNQYPNVNRLDYDYAGLVAWAFTKEVQSFGSYMDPVLLAEAFESAHKVLFAFAMQKMLEPPSDHQITSGTLSHEVAAVTVNEAFVIATMSILALLAVAGTACLLINARREQRQQVDPASLLSVLGSVGSSTATRVQEVIATSAEPEKALFLERFSLDSTGGSSLETPAPKINCVETFTQPSRKPEGGYGEKPYPRSLSLPILLLIFGSIVSAILALAVLKYYMDTDAGLPQPSQSSFVRQLLLSYLPTAYATLMEPVWVMLVRDLSVLQPFLALFGCGATAQQSLTCTFTAVPAQFSIFEALRRRRLLLAILGLMTLTSNVLSVVMSGLFETRLTTYTSKRDYNIQFEPLIQSPPVLAYNFVTNQHRSNSDYDYFYLLDQSIDPLHEFPSWTSTDFYFLPFDLDNSSLSNSTESASHEAQTTGFGMQPMCTSSNINISMTEMSWFDFSLQMDPSIALSKGAHAHSPDGDRCQSGGELDFYSGTPEDIQQAFMTENGTTSERLAAEATFQVNSGSINREQNQTAACNRYFATIWFRTNPAPYEGTLLMPRNGSHPAIATPALSCTTTLRVANFSVHVDLSGKVLNSTQLTPFAADPGSHFSNSSDVSLYEQMSAHWLGSDDIVNPAKPLPDPNVVAPQVEEVMRRFFPIYLSLNKQVLKAVDQAANESVAGVILEPVQRVFFAPHAFEIAITILGVQLLAVVLVMVRRPRRMLPRMPTTIMAVVSYVRHSTLLSDILSGRRTLEEIEKDRETKYAYGVFTGTDGRPHVGIDRVEKMVRAGARPRKRWWQGTGKQAKKAEAKALKETPRTVAGLWS